MNSTQYKQELEKAKIILTDLRERGTDAVGESWEDLRKELLSPEERIAGSLRVGLMLGIKKARHKELHKAIY